ncbi:MAG: glycosyltransferase [Bacteroidetes bacterium]|nr:glycosyltransferase [Bacteroidota bacterium]
MEENIKHKRFLICVLNWGIGHASRMIPIIRLLRSYGQTVCLASDGDALAMLRREFPDVEYCDLPAYDPVYQSGESGMLPKLLSQIPKFSRAIRQEHIMIERLVREQRIDIVISDNRYGCYSRRVRSILITHQLTIQMPDMLDFLGSFVNYYNRQQIKHFYRVWVPDFKDGRNLTGALSASGSVDRRYIGQLSRMHEISGVQQRYDIMALISGPEPQRTRLEDILRSQLQDYPGTSLLVRGKPNGSNEIKVQGRRSEVDYLDSEQLNLALQQAALVVCRSGYSTIMDLARLGKSAIFVPTPGQTEQICLARELEKKGIAPYREQRDFQLDRVLSKVKLYSGFRNANYENDVLDDVIRKVLK